MENIESFIGKEIKGFAFSGPPGYIPHAMNEYVNMVGTITCFRSGSVNVEFPNGKSWAYPLNKINEHLVEPELTIEQILNNIKKLTSEL